MPETKEVHLRFRVDEVVPEPNRTKLFFIIHQSMVDNSVDWGIPVEIVNHKQPVDPYSAGQSFMHTTKIHNQLSEHLVTVVNKYFSNREFNTYHAIRLSGMTEHELIRNGSILYLPQTNQIFTYADDWNPSILLSHEYVFIIN